MIKIYLPHGRYALERLAFERLEETISMIKEATEPKDTRHEIYWGIHKRAKQIQNVNEILGLAGDTKNIVSLNKLTTRYAIGSTEDLCSLCKLIMKDIKIYLASIILDVSTIRDQNAMGFGMTNHYCMASSECWLQEDGQKVRLSFGFLLYEILCGYWNDGKYQYERPGEYYVPATTDPLKYASIDKVCDYIDRIFYILSQHKLLNGSNGYNHIDFDELVSISICCLLYKAIEQRIHQIEQIRDVVYETEKKIAA